MNRPTLGVALGALLLVTLCFPLTHWIGRQEDLVPVVAIVVSFGLSLTGIVEGATRHAMGLKHESLLAGSERIAAVRAADVKAIHAWLSGVMQMERRVRLLTVVTTTVGGAGEDRADKVQEEALRLSTDLIEIYRERGDVDALLSTVTSDPLVDAVEEAERHLGNLSAHLEEMQRSWQEPGPDTDFVALANTMKQLLAEFRSATRSASRLLEEYATANDTTSS